MARHRTYKGKTYSKGRRTSRGRKTFKKGYDRTVGFYGRFSGPSGELKFKDTVISSGEVGTLMQQFPLLTIPQNNTQSGRIGRKVTIKKIHIKGTVELDVQTQIELASDTVVCMVVQDTQTNGVLFTPTQLLVTDAYNSFRNLAESKRFKILWRREYNLQAQAGSLEGVTWNSSGMNISVSANISCSIPIEYDATSDTGSVATIRSNNLYWVTLSKRGATDTILNARVRYSDN